MIRWVDMVDLRGKPPYLPDSKTYTDVLKASIEEAYSYYGFDPETYLETTPEVSGPALKRNVAPINPSVLSSLLTLKPAQEVLPVGVTQMTRQGVTTQITPQPSATATTIPAISISTNAFLSQSRNDALVNVGDVDVDDVNDEDEETENLPPKLPMPIGKMNCSLTRTVLAKLIRFHCGNQVEFRLTNL
jgi:hypothetical protein